MFGAWCGRVVRASRRGTELILRSGNRRSLFVRRSCPLVAGRAVNCRKCRVWLCLRPPQIPTFWATAWSPNLKHGQRRGLTLLQRTRCLCLARPYYSKFGLYIRSCVGHWWLTKPPVVYRPAANRHTFPAWTDAFFAALALAQAPASALSQLFWKAASSKAISLTTVCQPPLSAAIWWNSSSLWHQCQSNLQKCPCTFPYTPCRENPTTCRPY